MGVGQLLREARSRHGVTQTQLAARAGTSQAAISRIERELVSPSVATLESLLDVLGEELEVTASPVDFGHDVTLLDSNLSRTPDQRLDAMESFIDFVREIRGKANAA